MKIRGEVTAIDGSAARLGGCIEIVARCRFVRGSKHQLSHTVQFRVPEWAARSYYVGKIVTIEIGGAR